MEKENRDPFTEQVVGTECSEEPLRGALERVAAVAKLQDALDLLKDLEDLEANCFAADQPEASAPASFLRESSNARQGVYASISPSLLSPKPKSSARESLARSNVVLQDRTNQKMECCGALTGTVFGECLGTHESSHFGADQDRHSYIASV